VKEISFRTRKQPGGSPRDNVTRQFILTFNIGGQFHVPN